MGNYNIKFPSQEFQSSYINLKGFEYINIVFNQLSSNNNISPSGNNNVLKQILVGNVPYGEFIVDSNCNSNDYTNVSNSTLRRLEIKL